MPEGERVPFGERLAEAVAHSTVEVLPGPAPNAAPVSVQVEVEVDTGDTRQGPEFFAARARATVRLHRVSVVVTSRPGVSTEKAKRIRKALDDLVKRVALVLTW